MKKIFLLMIFCSHVLVMAGDRAPCIRGELGPDGIVPQLDFVREFISFVNSTSGSCANNISAEDRVRLDAFNLEVNSINNSSLDHVLKQQKIEAALAQMIEDLSPNTKTAALAFFLQRQYQTHQNQIEENLKLIGQNPALKDSFSKMEKVGQSFVGNRKRFLDAPRSNFWGDEWGDDDRSFQQSKKQVMEDIMSSDLTDEEKIKLKKMTEEYVGQCYTKASSLSMNSSANYAIGEWAGGVVLTSALMAEVAILLRNPALVAKVQATIGPMLTGAAIGSATGAGFVGTIEYGRMGIHALRGRDAGFFCTLAQEITKLGAATSDGMLFGAIIGGGLGGFAGLAPVTGSLVGLGLGVGFTGTTVYSASNKLDFAQKYSTLAREARQSGNEGRAKELEGQAKYFHDDACIDGVVAVVSILGIGKGAWELKKMAPNGFWAAIKEELGINTKSLQNSASISGKSLEDIVIEHLMERAAKEKIEFSPPLDPKQRSQLMDDFLNLNTKAGEQEAVRGFLYKYAGEPLRTQCRNRKVAEPSIAPHENLIQVSKWREHFMKDRMYDRRIPRAEIERRELALLDENAPLSKWQKLYQEITTPKRVEGQIVHKNKAPAPIPENVKRLLQAARTEDELIKVITELQKTNEAGFLSSDNALPGELGKRIEQMQFRVQQNSEKVLKNIIKDRSSVVEITAENVAKGKSGPSGDSYLALELGNDKVLMLSLDAKTKGEIGALDNLIVDKLLRDIRPTELTAGGKTFDAGEIATRLSKLLSEAKGVEGLSLNGREMGFNLAVVDTKTGQYSLTRSKNQGVLKKVTDNGLISDLPNEGGGALGEAVSGFHETPPTVIRDTLKPGESLVVGTSGSKDLFGRRSQDTHMLNEHINHATEKPLAAKNLMGQVGKGEMQEVFDASVFVIKRDYSK